MVDINELKNNIYDVIGAILEVKKGMGPGLNEYCYQEALQLQLENDKIPFLERSPTILFIMEHLLNRNSEWIFCARTIS